MLTDEVIQPDGRIRPECVDDILVEIIGGRHVFTYSGDVFASVVPNESDHDRARMVYVRILHEARSRYGLMHRHELKALAVNAESFDPQEAEQKKGLENLVRQLMTARDNTTNPTQKTSLGKQIEDSQRLLEEIIRKEESVLGVSAESIAEDAREMFFVFNCTKQGVFFETPVWNTWEDFQLCDDADFISEAKLAYRRVARGLPANIIRAVARSDEWRQRWRAAKESGSPLFGGHVASWDTNKINLISWSKFYETVSQHPDFPGEQLLFNDAGLQAWVNEKLAEVKKSKQNVKTPQTSSSRFKDGSGRIIPSQNLGQNTVGINQRVRIRTPGSKQG